MQKADVHKFALCYLFTLDTMYHNTNMSRHYIMSVGRGIDDCHLPTMYVITYVIALNVILMLNGGG